MMNRIMGTTCEHWQELDNECDTPDMVVYLTSLPHSAASVVGYITVTNVVDHLTLGHTEGQMGRTNQKQS